MKLDSKADTILKLKKYNLNFLIPKTYVFKTDEWKISKKEIINFIKKNFKSKIVIRSSSFDEDGKNQSQAGKYLSILGVNPNNKKKLEISVNKVIDSYKKINKNNKVIIQKQITKVLMSGVIFTHDLTNGSPYYIINYDDNSKKTDTVTSGHGEDSNKKLIIYRNGIKSLKSERFQKLLNCVFDLEKKIDNKYLDIEFVVDTDLKIYLLQVRNISTVSKWTINNKILNKKIKADKKYLTKHFKKRNQILSQMTDWNPAEIIGKNPKKLSSSIYSSLVTDKSWAIAREKMGYSKLKNKKLMNLYSGKPYIDVRKSFFSFIPQQVNIKDKNKIVDFWVENLKKSPFLHDKAEFNVAVTAYDFEIKKKLNSYLPNKITSKTKKKLEFLYKDIFIKNIKKNSDANLNKISKKINYLSLLQKKFSIKKSKKKNKENIKLIIKNCKKYGIIPFSQAARHGFIAKGLIDSLVSRKILTKKRSIELQKVVNTVTSNFLEDINLVIKNQMTKSIFFEKYGHLRPGAYDITSKNYREMKNTFFEKLFISKKHKFKLNTKERNKFNILLSKEKIDLSHLTLINYIIRSIELREYSKFIFSKSIDNIFKLIMEIIPKKLKNKEIVSYFSINEILNDKISNKLFLKRKNEYENNIKIFLPEVIKDTSAYDVIPYMFNVPNFITNNRVTGKALNIINNFKHSLENKIILIENADPGFDWIFTKKIKGFATQFGGANSHMAIRAAELDIPAVIGCGQKKFDELKNSSEIEIDCLNKKIVILK
jgi:phosphohistidine swiveling domain-containing protein